MGAGKSTAARSAARALGTDAIDVDELIAERLGKPIAAVFSEDGEAAFRAAEERITLELLRSRGGRVMALGGGAITHPSVRDALADHLVIWLDVPLEVAWSRAHASDRPLARQRSTFAQLYSDREPLYAEVKQALQDAVANASTLGMPPARAMGAIQAAYDRAATK